MHFLINGPSDQSIVLLHHFLLIELCDRTWLYSRLQYATSTFAFCNVSNIYWFNTPSRTFTPIRKTPRPSSGGGVWFESAIESNEAWWSLFEESISDPCLHRNEIRLDACCCRDIAVHRRLYWQLRQHIELCSYPHVESRFRPARVEYIQARSKICMRVQPPQSQIRIVPCIEGDLDNIQVGSIPIRFEAMVPCRDFSGIFSEADRSDCIVGWGFALDFSPLPPERFARIDSPLSSKTSAKTKRAILTTLFSFIANILLLLSPTADTDFGLNSARAVSSNTGFQNTAKNHLTGFNICQAV